MTREEKANEIAQRWMGVLLDGENFDKHDLYNICMQMAEWTDQNPRKGLWNNQKVIKFIKENVREYHKSGIFHVDDFIKNLCKAMGD